MRSFVNSAALEDARLVLNESVASILDISFVQVVVEDLPEWEASFETTSELPVEFQLGRYRFSANVSLEKKGEGWLRFEVAQMLPSAGASLRSYLSPKKIGESIQADWSSENLRHYHGLNETELWVDAAGPMTLVYLDPTQPSQLFVIRLFDEKAPVQIGAMDRKDWRDPVKSSETPLLRSLERDALFQRLGECRDIITNFRPSGQFEFHLKQRLLRVVSDSLYSAREGTHEARAHLEHQTNRSVSKIQEI